MKDCGIILVATKHPYYGRMAYNFAVSVKAVEPDIPIALLWSGRGISHLSPSQKIIFSHIKFVDEDGLGAKLDVYENSPFEKTLYIDADNLWLPKKKPSALFAELEGVGFTGITEGRFNIFTGENELRKDYFLWADIDQTIKAYGLSGTIHQWRSELMYFEKSTRNEMLFARAKEVYKNPKVSVAVFSGGVPDEFALNVAACELKIAPHQYKWQPCFWDKAYVRKYRLMKNADLYAAYWVLSTGGNRPTVYTKNIYTRLMVAACHKMGLQFLFQLQSKASIMQERQKM